jgi:hypothetical protein
MKNLIIILSILCASCNLKFDSSTQIVDNQEAIINNILNDVDFNIDDAIEQLENNFIIDYSIGNLNPVSNNNIAVRNHLLLSILYYLNNNQTEYNNHRDTSITLLNYNLINDSIWNEGSSYWLYTESAINAYLKVFKKDNEIETVKLNCNNWLYKYTLPDGKLPPIGDTRRIDYQLSYNSNNDLIFDSEETMIKLNGIMVFIRHPTKTNKYILSGHTNFDLGDICIYKNNKCIILPVGYPGFAKKKENKMGEMSSFNSLYLKSIENKWRFQRYSLLNVERTNFSVKITYKVNSKVVSREVKINGNEVTIKDTGTDGINLNVADGNHEITVTQGKSIENSIGLHSEDVETIVENKKVFIPCENLVTEIILNIK